MTDNSQQEEQSSQDLSGTFERMHEQGASSWFGDGEEERLQIYRLGRPWKGKTVLEIGCGEGHLAAMIAAAGASVAALDYSEKAIEVADNFYNFGNMHFLCADYREQDKYAASDILVMQGVLEHLDDPWKELKWMKDNLLKPDGTIITSSPCFLNPRGYVWITLAAMFQAPMSLTDKHFLHPWEFYEWSQEVGMEMVMSTCDLSWGNGPEMIEDLRDRLPKVMKDLQKKLGTTLPYRTTDLLQFLKASSEFLEWDKGIGATAIYRFSPKKV